MADTRRREFDDEMAEFRGFLTRHGLEGAVAHNEVLPPVLPEVPAIFLAEVYPA
jgi:hypothetical protein